MANNYRNTHQDSEEKDHDSDRNKLNNDEIGFQRPWMLDERGSRNLNTDPNLMDHCDRANQNELEQNQIPNQIHPRPYPEMSDGSSRLHVGIGIAAVLAFICLCWYNSSSSACNMAAAENRDFNRYYGIQGLKNHFTAPAADECDSNILFTPALPPAILKSDHSANSFLTLAKYGTGKSLLRCEYVRCLKSDSYLKVLILNKQISEYIDRFVKQNPQSEEHCKEMNCLRGWRGNELAQLLLSSLVTEFIHIFYQKQFQFQDITLEEKIKLITIICYYYNGFGTTELEHFINHFLKKSRNEIYEANRVIVQIQERNVAQDKPLLIHFKEDLRKFSILQREYERLHLLLAVVEGEGFQHRAIGTNMYGNIFNDLTHFTLYIKTQLNKIPVFVIDGIDENQYFFQNNAVNKASMESFCRSSVSQEILSKVMANNFYLSIFYPKIDGIDIQDAIVRKDKFPVHGINWNTKSLINYADYVLQEMNKNASKDRCEPFLDFKTLVNYSDRRIAEIIDKIPTPRALHYFMIELITEMNNDAADVESPFRATFENVNNAYEKSYEYYYKTHHLN